MRRTRNLVPVTFRGWSDDTFGWESKQPLTNCDQPHGEDHDDCAQGTVRVFRIRVPGRTMTIRGRFAEDGWRIRADGADFTVETNILRDSDPPNHAMTVLVPSHATIEHVQAESLMPTMDIRFLSRPATQAEDHVLVIGDVQLTTRVRAGGGLLTDVCLDREAARRLHRALDDWLRENARAEHAW